MPKISIIIPTYNSSEFIEKTIKSVISQTFKDWELLIVDDCSTDNTEEIINNITKNDTRIKLLKTSKNSGGPATPKNIGLDNSHGEYIAFLDHDDEWLPEKLEKQIEIFKNSKDKKLGLVSCFIDIKDFYNDKIISKYKINHPNITNNNYIYTCSSVLVKSSVIRSSGYFDTNLKTGDDWDMWIRIFNNGYSFGYATEYLLNYYVHKENICHGNENFNDIKEYKYFFDKNKDIFEKYNSLMVGYNYYINKKYSKAIIYYLKRILSFTLTTKEILKSLGFITLSLFPRLERMAKKIWRKINNQ